MRIVFANALVLEARVGTSKSGNPYCVLRFLDNDSLDVYDLMQFGDASAVASGLERGANVALEFDLKSGRDGGLRAELVGVAAVGVYQ